MFGARGEVEISRGNKETSVQIPWWIAIRASLALNVCTIFAICFLIILWSVIHWPSLWEFVQSKVVRLLLLPFPAEWIGVLLTLFLCDQIPRLKNANWPPPWAQMHPLESGFVTRRNMDDRRYTDRDEPQPVPWVMEATYKDASGKLWRERLETLYAPQWHRYAKALLNSVKWLRPNFSYRAAWQVARIPDDEFGRICERWLARGYVYRKPTPNGNSKTVIKRLGYVWLEMMATTPPPQQ